MTEPVFVYGILKTPRAFRDPPDRARGTLYVADGFAACIFGTDGWVRGEVRWVDAETLQRWDALEEIETGLYRRVRVRTGSGVMAWAYEYGRSVHGYPVVSDGVWLGRAPRR